jgi:hypothetical protein
LRKVQYNNKERYIASDCLTLEEPVISKGRIVTVNHMFLRAWKQRLAESLDV